MTNQFLTDSQLNEIKSIKYKVREDSELSSLIIVRKYIQEEPTTTFDPYELSGTVSYLDNVIKVRLIHIDNKWQRIEVGGNAEEAVYKILCSLPNYDLILCADEIILNHEYSETEVPLPSSVSNSSMNFNTYLGTIEYINYNTDGSIYGDRIKIMGQRELHPYLDEIVLYGKLYQVNR